MISAGFFLTSSPSLTITMQYLTDKVDNKTVIGIPGLPHLSVGLDRYGWPTSSSPAPESMIHLTHLT